MKKRRIKKIKIWWRIPNISDISNVEARKLIYRTMQIASDASKIYLGTNEEPHHFRTCWFITDIDKGIFVYNYIVAKLNDPRVKYYAQLI